MKRVVITGAAGFVGANLARRLVADAHEVHLWVRPGSNCWRIEELNDKATVHHLPLSSRNAVAECMAAIKPDWVFHLAAHGAYSGQRNFDTMVETNIHGTAALVDAAVANRVQALVYTGSSSEYGFQAAAADETSRVEPNSHYAITKAAATHYCQWAAREQGLSAVVMRLYSVYGPWEEPARFIPTLAALALEGSLPPLVAPDTARDFVYIDDAVHALVLAAARIESLPRGSIYNIASGRQSTIREVVDLVTQLLSLKVQPQWGTMAGRTWDTNRWVGSPQAILESLGWTAETSLRAGLEKTIAWLRDTPGMLRRYRSG